MRALVVPALVVALMTGSAAAARAAEGDPAIAGSVRGDLAHSPVLTFNLVGTAPGGWQDIQQLQVAVLFHSVVLDEILIDRAAGTVATVSSLPVKLGAGDEAAGSFFQVSGRDVELSAQGTHLRVTLRAKVVQTIPNGSTFSLGVIDRWGRTDRLIRSIQLPQPSNGFSWGTLAAAVIGALFAGSMIGGLFASRRRRATGPSVYALIQRRMEQERART